MGVVVFPPSPCAEVSAQPAGPQNVTSWEKRSSYNEVIGVGPDPLGLASLEKEVWTQRPARGEDHTKRHRDRGLLYGPQKEPRGHLALGLPPCREFLLLTRFAAAAPAGH